MLDPGPSDVSAFSARLAKSSDWNEAKGQRPTTNASMSPRKVYGCPSTSTAESDRMMQFEAAALHIVA
jgi:hypothetical protein